MADQIEKKAPLRGSAEIGVAGLNAYSGYINEEFHRDLRSTPKRNAIYRRMSTSDPVLKAILRAVSLVLRGVEWRVEPAYQSGKAGDDEAAFAESLMKDMSHSWEDFISEALSMLIYGWSYHEVVLKSRVGPMETDPSKRSKFTDGRIGIRKLAPRAQETLQRWEMQDDGGIDGFWQQPLIGGGVFFIPIDRALLFRTESRKNSPEGESLLRSAYESWYHATQIRNFESVGIERELAGLPVVRIPSEYLSATATPDQLMIREQYLKIARDVKLNAQGGLLVPSDMWRGEDGAISSSPLVSVELISSSGKRAIDTSAVILRHQRDMARSVLADFIMLGSDSKGSYALSKDKTDLFMMACKAILDQIAAPLNRFLLPRIWDYNGLDRALLPEFKPGAVADVDLAVLGDYIAKISAAGAPLFPDQSLDEYLRDIADLPAPDPMAADIQSANMNNALELALNPPVPPPPPTGYGDKNKPAGPDAGTGGAPPADKGGTQKGTRPFSKGAERTLYLSRDLLNADDVLAWAKSQGFTSAIPGDEMHVTIAYSKTPIDWRSIGTAPASLNVEYGLRGLEAFGDDGSAIVLTFDSIDLTMRNEAIRAAGASWDWDEYQPHISLTYDGAGMDLSGIVPYDGPLIFGPERFAPIKAGAMDDVVEEVIKYNDSQPRAPKGEGNGGQWVAAGGGAGSPASDLLARNYPNPTTADELFAKLTPEQRAAASKAEAEMLLEKPTMFQFLGPDGKYTAERVALHEKIINDIFSPQAILQATPKPGEKPVLTLTGGRPAAGKTSTLRGELGSIGHNALYISADTIQESLPGYRGDHAGLFNGEAQDIALQVENIARKNGLNIVYDATMKSQQPAKERVALYKSQGYSVHGYFVHTTPETSALRSMQRYKTTGRYVPIGVSLKSATNEKTFDSLIPEFDRWAIYDNNGTKPRKVAEGGK